MNGEARQGSVYLEPGELAELARAASAAASAAGVHPRALLLYELAQALDRMAEQPCGGLLLPAQAADDVEAAQHYLLTPNNGGTSGAGPGDAAGACGPRVPCRHRVAHPA